MSDSPIHDRLAAQYGIRNDMRTTLIDQIAAASIDQVIAGFEVLLIWAATAEDDDQ
jgi:hypothetical protein